MLEIKSVLVNVFESVAMYVVYARHGLLLCNMYGFTCVYIKYVCIYHLFSQSFVLKRYMYFLDL